MTYEEKKQLIQFHKTMALLLQQELDSVDQIAKEDTANQLSQMPIGVPLMELKEVLAVMKVSKSHWYYGIKDGLYPSPVKIGARKVAWRTSDITKLVNSFKSKK